MIDNTNTILIPGSMFENHGGWISDPQFMEVMKSSEMLAHGLGVPVEDAVTKFTVANAGEYRLWIRTRNWTAYWSDKPTPGVFHVIVDGVEIPETFGNKSSEWHWQEGGTVCLEAGSHTLAVHDLTGFDGRFDSVLLTLSDEAPGDIDSIRRNVLRISEPQKKGRFDFVVVGGGVAGMCAAISAARLGQRVAIIQDRKVFGGNNSSEVRVGLGGRLNIGKFPSLGYLLNEFGPASKGNARTADIYEDDKKLAAIDAEKNITSFIGYRVTGVRKKGERQLTAVIATNVDDYSEIIVEGRIFADCTGDAVLGFLAGAEWVMGREAKSVYNEPHAPEQHDCQTLGASIQWYSETVSERTSFPDIEWGLPINDETVQNARRGQWYWEVGMRDNMIDEAEKIRDYGMYVAYSNWSYAKNHSKFKDELEHEKFAWLSFYAGKRESRRLKGEIVLSENDLLDFKIYPDGCVSTSWYIDDHEPDPENAKVFKDPWLSRGRLTPLDFYPIPFRCLYNKDIDNMFMAGRDISVSHLALGTVRVMRTCAMEGEVIGMAASLCRKFRCLPADIYRCHFDKLEKLMNKGAGDTNKPYLQVYTLIDTTAARSEDC